MRVRPGDGANVVNTRSAQVPVAVLSQDGFDPVADLDLDSLRLGATGREDSLRRCRAGRDYDGDGVVDLLCQMRVRESGLAAGDTSLQLRGSTKDGVRVVGTRVRDDGPGARQARHHPALSRGAPRSSPAPAGAGLDPSGTGTPAVADGCAGPRSARLPDRERERAGRCRDPRPGAAGVVRGVPPAQRQPRQDVLPRDAAAAGVEAAVRARAVRLRPLRRRDRRRPRQHADRCREGRLAGRLGRAVRARRRGRRERPPDQPGRRRHGPPLGVPMRLRRGVPGQACAWT